MDCERDQPCSVNSLRTGEQLVGTAPHALGWVAIEQPGPYGHDALLDSHFPTEIGVWLRETLPTWGIKAILIRAPGRHADAHHDEPRRIYLACSKPGQTALGSLLIDDPAELQRIDFTAVAAGDLPAAHPDITIENEPLLLICTHAKRDVCCALRGRPVVQALAGESERVWECSHIGGHRFAPVALQLPDGWVHGRFDDEQAREILAQARIGQVLLASARGRSSLSTEDQLADLELRIRNANNALT